jgi:hypothetical protein
MDSLSSTITLVWVLHDRARPRVDALHALVRDGARVDASVAGSKILDEEDPRLLVSVGTATDVFDAPYSGLEEGELDQSQYDVVRDVAAVSAISMLIRRDLFFGLRGVDPLMAPRSAAIDFCQRARLRGARVVVAPSSEVLYAVPERVSLWRERAGEIRSMVKVYSLVTLAWAIPLAFLTGLVESIVSPFLGRWRLTGFLAAWGWNLIHLPSAIRARFVARRGRQVGDEELFRYQVGGSARLRGLYDETLERVRSRFPEGILSGFSDVMETGQQRFRSQGFIFGALGLLFALAATRRIWMDRLPVSGFALPPPGSALDALGAYAGGWNPAGLGSPEVLHPSVGATSLSQLLLFGNGGAAVAVLTLIAFVAGVFGTARLLHGWGMASATGYLAGAVLMGGPATAALAGEGQWAPLLSLGALPWVLVTALRPWPATWWPRAGRVAAVTLVGGVVAVFAPAAILVAPVAAVLWAFAGAGRRWTPAVLVLAGAVLALPLLMPWVLYVDLGSFLSDGAPAFWTPSWPALIGVAVALVASMLSGDRVIALVSGWGGLVAVAGTLAARTGDLGAGREVRTAGLLAVALGTAAVVGAAIEFASRRERSRGLRLGTGVVAVTAGLALVAATALLAGPGRAGLPGDRYSDLLNFAAAGDAPASRVLLFGPAEALPGTSRDLQGLGYRVLDPPVPNNWDAYLGEARLGDDTLRAFLDSLLDGDERRAGATLAGFGIGWVGFLEPSPLEAVFEAQLDMVALRSLDIAVFRNEEPGGAAVGDDGTVWIEAGTGYRAPDGWSGSSVRLAGNADDRWGPGRWEQQDWAAVVAVDGDEVSFARYAPRRRMALGSAGWLAALAALAVVGRWRGRT